MTRHVLSLSYFKFKFILDIEKKGGFLVCQFVSCSPSKMSVAAVQCKFIVQNLFHEIIHSNSLSYESNYFGSVY